MITHVKRTPSKDLSARLISWITSRTIVQRSKSHECKIGVTLCSHEGHSPVNIQLNLETRLSDYMCTIGTHDR
jgi:hypothetical protein